MFDAIGHDYEDHQTRRMLVAGLLVLLALGTLTSVVSLIQALYEVVQQPPPPPPELQLVEVVLDDPELPEDAPNAPPPPPPPPSTDRAPDPEPEPEEPIEPEADEMAEEPPELEPELPEPEPVQTAEVDPGEEGGSIGGEVGGDPVHGKLGGTTDGVAGGTVGGGVRKVHVSQVRFKRKSPYPVYPDAAKSLDLGPQNCKLIVSIDTRGVPEDVEFVACPSVFHQSARQAILQWRWFPYRDDRGVKQRVRFPMNIRYVLR